MIGIIGYGLGNVSAFANIYKKLDIPHNILKKPEDFDGVSKLILPGVGAFDHAMNLFNDSGMREITEELVLNKSIPILGVCVGMQMMAETSEEGECDGLGWIKGNVVKFKTSELDDGAPMPHMGWNTVSTESDHELLTGLKNSRFYFLHSYHMQPENYEYILCKTYYGKSFCSIVKKNNFLGMQCHPEKSHDSGIQFLSNFAKF